MTDSPLPPTDDPPQPAHQRPPPIALPHPMRLIWSAPQLVRPQVVQVLDLLPTVVAGSDEFALGIAGTDTVEVSQISINGKPYAIHRIGSPPDSRDTLHLHRDRLYRLFPVARNGDDITQDGEYVLARQQELPDTPGQMVVALEPKKKRAWVIEDGSENDIRIISGWGERQWDYRDSSEPIQLSYESLKISGIVEALLVPIQVEPEPPQPLPAPEERINQKVAMMKKYTIRYNSGRTRTVYRDAQGRFVRRKDTAIQRDRSLTNITLISVNKVGVEMHFGLTPHYLTQNLGPYLSAIADIQLVLDEMGERTQHEVRVTLIKQSSPISVSLEGAAEAAEFIEKKVVPRKRKMAEERERMELEKLRAEVIESRTRADKQRAEAELKKAEAVGQQIENRRRQLELIPQLYEIVSRLKPNLSDAEKISYVTRLLPAVQTIMDSDLQISHVTNQ